MYTSIVLTIVLSVATTLQARVIENLNQETEVGMKFNFDAIRIDNIRKMAESGTFDVKINAKPSSQDYITPEHDIGIADSIFNFEKNQLPNKRVNSVQGNSETTKSHNNKPKKPQVIKPEHDIGIADSIYNFEKNELSNKRVNYVQGNSETTKSHNNKPKKPQVIKPEHDIGIADSIYNFEKNELPNKRVNSVQGNSETTKSHKKPINRVVVKQDIDSLADSIYEVEGAKGHVGSYRDDRVHSAQNGIRRSELEGARAGTAGDEAKDHRGSTCGHLLFLPSKQTCCSGRVHDNLKAGFCCGTAYYIASPYIRCRNGVLWPVKSR